MHLSGCQYKLGSSQSSTQRISNLQFEKKGPLPEVIPLQNCSKTGSFEVIRVYLGYQMQAVVKITFHIFLTIWSTD